MSRQKVISASDAARLIPDGAIVTVSSSSALGCPDAVLAAIGEQFETEGHPRNLTTLHPIAAGDMWGVKGVDHLAKAGCLARVLAGSYPSGPSSAEPPAIWKMITGDAIPAYNVPSGILFDIHREAAAKRPGVLTKVGMDTFVDPVHEGCAMNARAASEPIVERVNFAGDEWLFFPTITPQIAIIRATTADERGNLSYEHEGGILGPLDQALAVRNNGGIVIAQVKRLAASGTLRPHDVIVPGILVDYVVIAPDQLQTTHTPYEPAISGEIFRPLWSFETPKFDIAKVIARRVAQELREGDAVNIGFGISANVPRILIEEGRHGAVTWVIEQGAVGGVPLLDFQFGCASNAEAIVPSPAQFTYFQGGGFDMSLLSFLQIDRLGSVNVSKLGVRPHVTAGAGGFVDITARARKIVFSGYFTAGAKLEISDGAVTIARRRARSRSLFTLSSRSPFRASGNRSGSGNSLRHGTLRPSLGAGRRDGCRIGPGRRLEARRPWSGRVSAEGGSGTAEDGPGAVSSRADQSRASPSPGAAPMSPFVELTFEGPLARLTMRRADKLNALDRAMIDALAEASRAIEASRDTRVAILSGEGKAFCAGGDIAAWGELPALEMWRDWTRAGHRAFEALARLRVPLIAALTGHAFGGGLELAGVADIRVAESGIKLGLPESGLGMAPGWSGTQRLVRRFGPSVVRRMALAGAMFTAEEGLALGLVDEVTPKGEGVVRAEEIAADIAKRGPLAVQMIKAMINFGEGEDRDAPIEGLAGALTATTEDLAEGVAAFRAKRGPAFVGR